MMTVLRNGKLAVGQHENNSGHRYEVSLRDYLSMLCLSFILITLLYFNTPIHSAEMQCEDTLSNIRTVYDCNPRDRVRLHFRAPNTEYAKDATLTTHPTRLGLSNLHASASGQLTLSELDKIKESLSPKYHLLLVDLRKETHGFIEGEPVSLYQLPNSLQGLDVFEREGKCVKMVSQLQQLSIRNEGGAITIIEKPFIQTEKEVAEKMGISYLRFPIKNGQIPSDETIDALLNLLELLDPNTWVHFHCNRGCGRATTLFVMFDMLYNSQLVSMEDIILRHSLMGGAQLGRKRRYEAHRIFLKKFYSFAKLRLAGQAGKWSEYVKKGFNPQ